MCYYMITVRGCRIPSNLVLITSIYRYQYILSSVCIGKFRYEEDKKMIAVIDYGAGNIGSAVNALKELGLPRL